MKKITDRLGPIGWLALGAVFVCGISMLFVPARILTDTSNVVILCLSIAIIVSYAPGAWDAAHARPVKNGDILAFGIWAAWLATGSWRIMNAAGFKFGMEWLFRSNAASLIMSFAIIGGACHVLAPDVIDGRVPRRKWIKVGIIAGIGTALAMALIVMKG